MSKFNKIFFYPSILVLILVNLTPLLGVLYFSWDIFSIIILYWMESAVVGFFNILKMQKINNYKFTPFVPLFITHYSLFMMGHLFFIVSLKIFQPNLPLVTDQFEAFAVIFQYFKEIFISLAFIFFSHGISFVFNFIKQEEFVGANLVKQMIAPYKRIFIMQLVIIFAGGSLIKAGYQQAFLAIVLLVLLKTIFDLLAHIFEHRKNILN